MSPETRKAIEMLANADPATTLKERQALQAVLADDWYPAGYAAARLDCSVRWLRWQISAGRWAIERSRQGHRTTLYRSRDVERVREVRSGDHGVVARERVKREREKGAGRGGLRDQGLGRRVA